MKEMKIDPNNIDHINALQFFYTYDLSEESIIDYCQKYQNPEMFLLIVSIEWPAYQYDNLIPLPRGINIKHRENIRIIKHDLFSTLIGLKGEYKTAFNEIIDLNYNFNALQQLSETSKIVLHETTELKNDLKQKKWFFLI